MRLTIIGSAKNPELISTSRQHYAIAQAQELVLIEQADFPRQTLTFDQPAPIDAGLYINISPDNMSASAIFLPAINGGATPAIENLYTIFKNGGIQDKFIDNSAIEYGYRNMRDGNIVSDLTIAFGRLPVHGVDEGVRLLFREPSSAPKKDDNDKVNFRELDKYVIVKKEQLVAKSSPLIDGTPGENIFGQQIPAIKGKPKVLKTGAGICTNDELTEYYAEYDGYILYENDILSISDTITIDGDLDFGVGNLDFPGKVIIKGDTNSGFTVRAKEIYIEGVCQECNLFADSSITVAIGVRGAGKGLLVSGGDINIGYAENVKLMAEHDIIINKHAINCKLNAGNAIEAKDGSLVAGGEITFIKRGALYNVGKENGSVTIIHMGKQHAVDRVLGELEQDKVALSYSMDKINSMLDKTEADNDPKVKKLLETKALILSRFELLEQKIKRVLEEADDAAPTLTISGTVQYGTQIYANNIMHIVKDTTRGVEFGLGRNAEGGEQITSKVLNPYYGNKFTK